MKDIPSKSVIIVTHYVVYGASFALRDYLIKKHAKKLIFLAYPFLKDDKLPYIEMYQAGSLINSHSWKRRINIAFAAYVVEFISTIARFGFSKDVFDVYVGVDPLNTLAGVVLKFFGKVDTLVYYTIDYVPVRFQNKMINAIYRWMDKTCLRFADQTWNVSPRIADGRHIVAGLDYAKYPRQRVVPIGAWFEKVKRLPFEEIKKHQIFFVGHLLEKQGVQLLLEALPEIARKIPDIHVVIAGGGEYENTLKDISGKLGIENRVTFLGWVDNRQVLDVLMADSAVAIALYDRKTDYFTYYADPGKLKDYMSAGLPVIMTDVSYNAYELEKNRCAIITSYDKEDVARKIISLLGDEKTLREYRENAIRYARKLDWEQIFNDAFEGL